MGLRKEGTNVHLDVKAPFTSELQIDQSVAHDGVCLTVVHLDGDVYTALYEWAQENPMNDGPDGNGVVDGYAEFIRPLLDRGKQAAEARGAVLADATFGAASMATKARL